MSLYVEVSNRDIKRLGIKKAIQEGLFMVWYDAKIKRAFSFGNGTIKDFNRYKNDNKQFCTIQEIDKNELMALYPYPIFLSKADGYLL